MASMGRFNNTSNTKILKAYIKMEIKLFTPSRNRKKFIMDAYKFTAIIVNLWDRQANKKE